MLRRTARASLTKEEILQVLQDISDNKSSSEIGSDEEYSNKIPSDLSDEDWIGPAVSSESDSSDRDSIIQAKSNEHNISPSDSENEEHFSLATSCGIAVPESTRGRVSNRSRGRSRGRGRYRGCSKSNQGGANQRKDEELANDGTVWKAEASSTSASGRRPQQNVLREVAGPTSYAIRKVIDGNSSSAWRLFINEKILRHIQQCTEAEARQKSRNPNWCLSLDELDAFISLLYARGALAAKGLSILSLWSQNWGSKFFNETMARDRFLEIMKYLRFDFKSTRSQRLPTDQFALVSEVWNSFIENCLLCYKPGENITVDEQLFPTKTRCRFIQYMPKKPDKFGIKFWLASDVQTKYLLNGYPYLGKDETRPIGETVGEHAVYRLLEPYYGTGRNVTTDNFFTSIKLVKKLNSKGISCVGTVNRSKIEIPTSFKKTRDDIYSSKIVKHGNISLTSYQGKKNKNVLLMSTLHPTLEVTNNEKKTPEVVNFYNSTKYGVDVLDQMARKYSVKSSSRRWPVQVFFNILDMAAINAWIIYRKTTSYTNISRRNYILDIAEELRKNYISSRKPECPLSNPVIIHAYNRKRKQCQVTECNGNKTVNVCANCKKYVCGPCTGKISKVSLCLKCKNE